LDTIAAADALGRIRDPAAVPLLWALAANNPDSLLARYSIMSLGFIGTPEAEAMLHGLLDSAIDEDEIVQGLIACGSRPAMTTIIARAREKPNGPLWLCERLDRLTWTRGWSSGEYYTHIDTVGLVEYLESTHQPGEPMENWRVCDALRQIDSPEVRRLLRAWAGRRGMPADPLVRADSEQRMSDVCFWELIVRGDDTAIRYVLDSRGDVEDGIYVAIARDRLRHFTSTAVAVELRLRLSMAADRAQVVRMLALLGRFGAADDGPLVSRYLDDPDEMVANVACEVLLRLTDPLLVPDGWREM
jgi:hypothetical protein